MDDNVLNVELNNKRSHVDLIADNNMQILQHQLLEMGFDLIMINKVITYFHVKTTDEALYYLIKNENDGLWNHPFIPLEQKENIQINNVIKDRNPEQLVNKAISQFRPEQQVCTICGEGIASHRIKEEEEKNDDNLSENIRVGNTKNIEMIEMKNKKEEEEKKEDDSLCGICLGEFENPIRVQNCNHKFCQECFVEYLNNKIKINDIEKIPCPNQKCNNKQIDENFFLQYLTEEQAYKYASFKSKNEIAKDPYKVFCPLCDSYAEIPKNIIIDKDILANNQLPQTELTCIKNQHKFCSCGRPIHEGKCYVPGEDIKKFIETEKIKKCPKCGFLIKKDRGCNHMICGNPTCKYEFCWLCMNESLPDHYRFGPCAGMQFADEDGLLYRIRDNPCLVCIYRIFQCFFCCLSIIAFLLCPPLTVVLLNFSSMILSPNPSSITTKRPLSSNMHRFLNTGIFCIIVSITLIILPIFYFFYVLVLTVFMIWFMFSMVKCLLYCFCCCCCIRDANRNNQDLISHEEVAEQNIQI